MRSILVAMKPAAQSPPTDPAPKSPVAGPRYRRLNPGVARRTLKRSQRQRLIDAMIELSAQRGYHAVSITELCSCAGVSPVTFYELPQLAYSMIAPLGRAHGDWSRG
jgi:hypothetical protein